MVKITLKGREIPLLYTTYELKLVQTELGRIGKVIDRIVCMGEDGKKDPELYGDAEHIDELAKLLTILGNAGLEESGETADLTEKWVLRAIRPGDFNRAIDTCLEAMREGMESEYQTEEEQGPVDVTLEEMNKKKERDG